MTEARVVRVAFAPAPGGRGAPQPSPATGGGADRSAGAPGYTTPGRLFAFGYVRGLMHATA